MKCLQMLLYWVAEIDDVSNLEIDIEFHSSTIMIIDRNKHKEALAGKLDLLRHASIGFIGHAVPYDLFYNKSMDIWTLTVSIKFEGQYRPKRRKN